MADESPSPALIDVAEATDKAVTLHKHGRLQEALAIYDAILRDRPDHFQALHMKGVIARQRGNPAEAVRLISQAIEINSKSADAFSNHGLALTNLGKFTEAIASFDKALALQSRHFNAHYNRGRALAALERFDDALVAFDQAEALDRNHFELFIARGHALFHLKRYEDALAACDRALLVKPGAAKAIANRAAILRQLGRNDEALSAIDNAIALEPDFGVWHNTRGNILRHFGRHEEAIAALNKALELKFQDSSVFNNRGMCFLDFGRTQDALADFEKALALKPDYHDARFGRALASLRLGDLEKGWKDYESRWHTDETKSFRRNFSREPWLGLEPLKDKTIVIHWEQGLGDTIQFIRYATPLAEKGAKVIAVVQSPLKELAATVPGVTQVIDQGTALPPFDLHCPLMSLPLALGTRVETIPAFVPYMHAAKSRISHWNKTLFKDSRLRIGLAWAGSPTHRLDRERSMTLKDLQPILALADIEFVSLQLSVTATDKNIIQNHPRFHHPAQNFSETAAIISTLDLVVTVDTSIAHLSGALGKPVWTMLSFCSDFRWMMQCEDSPWYPTMRLFRQQKPGDWAEVIARMTPSVLQQRDRHGHR